MGKTSLLHALKSTVDGEEGLAAVYVSVQGATTELDFVRAVYDAASKHPVGLNSLSRRSPLSRLLGRVSEVDVAGLRVKLEQAQPTHWQDAAGDLAKALTVLPGHWFLLLDEMPVFVARLLRDDPTKKRAREFLEWFRALRQRIPGEEITLHWILAGSIGLDTIAHKEGLTDTINDLQPMRLGAYDAHVARQFLQELGNGESVPLTAEVIEHLLSRAGWPIPYHLQVLFRSVRDRHRTSGVAPSRADVDECVEDILKQSSYFDSWHERLDAELGASAAAHARTLLDACAKDPTGASRQTLQLALGSSANVERDLRFLLGVLGNDGYVIEQKGRYLFRSNLLREFWLRRYA